MARSYGDVFAIDGRVFNLPIFHYEISAEILDGEATGRSMADKWPMFRQPQGVIKHIDSIEFGLDAVNKHTCLTASYSEQDGAKVEVGE